MRRRPSSRAFAVASVLLVVALAGCDSTAGAPALGSHTPGPAATGSTDATPPTAGTTSPGPAMALDRFWQLVAGTYAHDPDEQAAALEPRLRGLSTADLTGYQRRYVQLADALATPEHYAAAQVLMGSVSSDVFVDLRTWVVFQGRASYEAFLTDPDSMADWGPTDDEQVGAAEALEYLPDRIAGATPPWADDATSVDDAPTTEPQPLTYAELRRRLPRLCARYLPPDLTATAPGDDGVRPVHRYS